MCVHQSSTASERHCVARKRLNHPSVHALYRSRRLRPMPSSVSAHCAMPNDHRPLPGDFLSEYSVRCTFVCALSDSSTRTPPPCPLFVFLPILRTKSADELDANRDTLPTRGCRARMYCLLATMRPRRLRLTPGSLAGGRPIFASAPSYLRNIRPRFRNWLLIPVAPRSSVRGRRRRLADRDVHDIQHQRVEGVLRNEDPESPTYL